MRECTHAVGVWWSSGKILAWCWNVQGGNSVRNINLREYLASICRFAHWERNDSTGLVFVSACRRATGNWIDLRVDLRNVFNFRAFYSSWSWDCVRNSTFWLQKICPKTSNADKLLPLTGPTNANGNPNTTIMYSVSNASVNNKLGVYAENTEKQQVNESHYLALLVHPTRLCHVNLIRNPLRTLR